MGEMASRLEAFGELEIDPATDTLLRRASAATLERLLAADQVPVRKRTHSLTKPGTLLRNRIAVRTFRDWDDARPGFVEVDTVAHCGPTVEGFHLWTVTAVDDWVGDMDVVWGKTQERVGAAIRRMHRRLPVPLWAWTAIMGRSSSTEGSTPTARRTGSASPGAGRSSRRTVLWCGV